MPRMPTPSPPLAASLSDSEPPADALEEWRRIVGPEHVRTAEAERQGWGRRTFAPDVRVSAVVSPGDADQTAACLAVATRHRLPVHPVSRGANWGLGSRAPTRDGAVVLDLRRLDRISGFDGERGLVRVEAGVTFHALAAFLAERTDRFFVPVIGGPAEASALANALDRGDGSMGERWTSLCELEVALADGRRLRTGCGPLGAERTVGLDPAPAGPLIDGLFSQSNLGVVTSAVIRLEAMPSDLAILSVDIGGLDALPAFLDLWRDCQREQSLPDRSLTLWNGIKWLALDDVRASVPTDRLAPAALNEWHASALIRAEAPEVLEARADRLSRRFAAVSQAVELDVARRDGAWIEGYEDWLGVPDGRNLRTVYWRKDRHPDLATADPDRDGCGLIWLCLAFPFEFGALADYLTWARERLEQAGIDLNVGIESNSFRCLLTYFTLGFDRAMPGADEAALAAYRDLIGTALDRGFAPYRLANGLPVPEALRRSPAAALLTELRAVGDPAGVLSPGRNGLG
ncbi:FAD-binding oxidoreductase [Azospirillum sp. TSO5]|uniref:FAD-binding oxidoreductase n=1 Tax=Azospirillum sp. TSO5 TaxID=716760 RepID=UPI001304D672|nr:FAD-binding oxidoreductase [Azospirillum sp. TSO5]